MSTSFNSSIITAEQRHLLLIGYIHRSCHAETIPSDLIDICSKFLDGSVQWILSGNELQQFLSAKNGEVIVGPSFTMHDVQFNLYLTPNGINASEQGYVQFLASPTFTSSNLYSITIWYSLGCKQTNTEWNNSTIFYYDDSDCASWPVCTLSLPRITTHFLSNHDDTLQFDCNIDILNIEYMDDTASYYSCNDIIMNRYARFQWNIYDELLTKFRYCVCGKYYFKHINVNWMLETAPNGQTEDDEGSVNVLLSVLRLPNKVSAVLVHMILHCDYNDITWDLIMKFDYECNQSYGWPEYTLLSSNLLSTTSITFTVQISILEVYDTMDREIPSCQWNAYGIRENRSELEKKFDLGFKQRHKAQLELRNAKLALDKAQLELQQRMVQMKTHKIFEPECINDVNEATTTDGTTNGDSSAAPQMSKTKLFVDLLTAASHFM